MATTWKVLIDWDRNGDFADANDDVTSYVLNAKWHLGSFRAYFDVANDSTLALVLNNDDKRFSPENSGSPLSGKLLPLRAVRVTSKVDSNPETIHWQGWIQNIMPVAGQYGERRVQIAAAGALQFLKAAESKIKLQENKRTDEVIDTLIQEVVFPPSVLKGAFLNIPGFNQVSVNAYVVDMDDIRQLDTGSVTLALAADNWVREGGFADRPKDTFDVYRGIRDMAATEQGRFFFDRTGKARFFNRQKLLESYTIVPGENEFTDTMNDLKYTYGSTELLKNDIIVICHPRTISASDQDVLWELDGSIIRVAPNDTRSMYVKYEDENETRTGARDVTVTDLEFEKGTATVTVDARANGAELTFTNSSNAEAIVKKCIVRGRRIIDKGFIEARAEDEDSIAAYGRRTLRINLPSIDNLQDAQYIADFELIRRKDPIGQMQALTTISQGKLGGGQHDKQLALTIGDFIRISETQTTGTGTGEYSDHIIIGEAHELSEGATYLKTTWYLEPVTAGNWAFVDEAKLYGDGTESPDPYTPYVPFIVSY